MKHTHHETFQIVGLSLMFASHPHETTPSPHPAFAKPSAAKSLFLQHPQVRYLRFPAPISSHSASHDHVPPQDHQIVSVSPKTNHTGKKNCGNVKGGFDRTDFFRKCETSFDKRTGYDRAPEQTFDYLNTMKNGSPKEIFQKKEWAERVNHERLEKMKAEWSRDLQEPHQEQGREEIQQQGNSISQVPDIDQAPLRKKQLEEELDQPRKRSRGFGMGM